MNAPSRGTFVFLLVVTAAWRGCTPSDASGERKADVGRGDDQRSNASDSLASPASAASTLDAVPIGHSDRSVDYYAGAALASAANALSHGGTTARVLQRRPALFYVQARRVVSGTPEIHDDWADVTFVQAGRAVLRTGGRVDGSHVETTGEHRGGTMVAGTSRPLAAGDFIMIPAGVAHRYELAAGDSIRYLTVKVRRTGVTP